MTPVPEDQVQPMLRLIINMDPRTVQVSVNGPLALRSLCYGMLEMAKDIVRDFNPEADRPNIEIPRGEAAFRIARAAKAQE